MWRDAVQADDTVREFGTWKILFWIAECTKKRAKHRTGPFAATSGKQLRVFRGDERHTATLLVVEHGKRTHSQIQYTRTRTVFIVTSKDRRVSWP